MDSPLLTPELRNPRPGEFHAASGCPNFELEPSVNSSERSGLVGVGGVTTLKSGQVSFLTGRVLVWFSCGAPSAVAAKMAVEKYRGKQPVEVLYCDTLKYEHPDNPRFMADVAAWLGVEIKLLRSERYADIFDVFDRTGWLVGPHGAKCTEELKREVRKAYQWAEDTHVFGYRADEADRIKLFESENPGLFCDWLLPDSGMSQSDCYRMLREAGIALPAMYRLGYRNNNCIGCVKGQAGYWNKIRRDFPESFARMALQERKMNAAINKRYEGKKRIRVFLDDLPPDAGRYDEEPDIECGPQCVMPVKFEEAFDGKLCAGGGGAEPGDGSATPRSGANSDNDEAHGRGEETP